MRRSNKSRKLFSCIQIIVITCRGRFLSCPVEFAVVAHRDSQPADPFCQNGFVECK